MIKVEIKKSKKKDKRYMVIVEDEFKDKKKTIHFGSKNGSTYIDHQDDKIKDAWIKRHRVREDWTDFFTAGFWAKHILWNQKTLEKAIGNLEKSFKMEIV